MPHVPHLGLVTLLVHDYDEAIAFYVGSLGFDLVEDSPAGEGKRWVVVAPPASRQGALLLARADREEQRARVGDQTGGRVGWFLVTESFAEDYARMRAAGVVFEESPRHEPHGTVAVFRDLYGNRWDLIQRSPAVRALPRGSSSLLVRTDFADDRAWRQLLDEALAVSDDGFQAYVEPVDDRAFEGVDWQDLGAAVPPDENGASVLFVADRLACGSPEHPILVVPLSRTDVGAPFRVVPRELWAVENNLNIANMDWQDFTHAVDEDGVFRGFGS